MSFMMKQHNLKRCIFKYSHCVFSTQTSDPKYFVPIYPGDEVIVYPPWGRISKLNNFENKKLEKNKKFQEQNEIQTGTVINVNRKKGEVVVEGVNKEFVFIPPESYIENYQKEEYDKIERNYEEKPIDIRRVRIRDLNSIDKLKPLPIKTIRTKEGKIQRINKLTGEEVKVTRSMPTYDEVMVDRKTGPKDTPRDLVNFRSFKGIDFHSVAKGFVNQLIEMKNKENLMVLKD